jgi:hypothetical protein
VTTIEVIAATEIATTLAISSRRRDGPFLPCLPPLRAQIRALSALTAKEPNNPVELSAAPDNNYKNNVHSII